MYIQYRFAHLKGLKNWWFCPFKALNILPVFKQHINTFIQVYTFFIIKKFKTSYFPKSPIKTVRIKGTVPRNLFDFY
jgi:hypothetical protein